jgi:hypothetical protein
MDASQPPEPEELNRNTFWSVKRTFLSISTVSP